MSLAHYDFSPFDYEEDRWHEGDVEGHSHPSHWLIYQDEAAVEFSSKIVGNEGASPGLPAAATTSRQGTSRRVPRFVVRIARALTRQLDSDPEWLMRKALYVSCVLTIAGVFLGSLELTGAVFAASAVLLVWGSAGLATFVIHGTSMFDPRLSFVLVLVGAGTAVVGLVAFLT